MSPYRVVVNDRDGNKFIYVAMISTDKVSGAKRIYIMQRPYIANPENTEMVDILNEEKDVAYSMSTKRNSQIVDRYLIMKQDNKRYRLDFVKNIVHRVELTDVIGRSFRTLQECQMAAITHFARKEELKIVRVL